jgi:hypothetical protein
VEKQVACLENSCCGIVNILVIFLVFRECCWCCDLRPRGPGSGSFAQSSTCSCTRGDHICRTAQGTCQCLSHCMPEQQYHSAGHWWCLAMALGRIGGSDHSTECTFRRWYEFVSHVFHIITETTPSSRPTRNQAKAHE